MFRVGNIFRKWFILIMPLWVLLVLYPNPANLVVSIKRVFYPEIDTTSIAQLANALPDDPADIEREVLLLVPYSCDWETYGMPWYFPTAKEIIQKGEGDCKARAIILASVLDAKGISYSINLSITHMWVDYEEKTETVAENSEIQYSQHNPQTGERSFQLPPLSAAENTKNIKALSGGFWTPMPLLKKLLLTIGLTALFVLRFTWLRKKKDVNKELKTADGSEQISSS